MPPCRSLSLLLFALAMPPLPRQGPPPPAGGGAGAASEGAAQDGAGSEAAREEAFDDAYARIQDVMEAQRWKEAYNRLRRLLDEHANADYVVDRLAPIEADLKRCAFWQSRAEPRLEDLLEAELLTWNRNTGGLRLRVEPGHLSDFRAHVSDNGELFELPAQLSGDWSVTLRGTAESLAGAQVYLLTDEKTYAFVVGCFYEGSSSYKKHAAVVIEGESQSTQGLAEPAATDRKDDCEVRVEVSERDLQLFVDGREMLDVARDDQGGFGRMAFATTGEFSSLVFAGRAESGWLDGIIDAAVQKSRDAFEAAWNPAEHLPAWLLAAGGAQPGQEASDLGPYPLPAYDLRERHPRSAEHALRVDQLLKAGRPDEAVRYLRALGPKEADPSLRALLECTCLYVAGRPGEALDAGAALWAEQAESLMARYLKALILVDLKRDADALEAFRTLTEEHPKAWEPWYALTSLLLTQHRLEEARAALDRGQEQAAEPRHLRRLEGRLVLLFKGPAWRREYVQRAGHFVVHTDTDVHTCQQVARACDAAWRQFERLFGAVELPDGATTPVFLFKGQAGFRAYAENAFKRDLEHTAGLFDRYLQAILLWNAPAREMLDKTLRHEVLHHYLDARMGALPTWFNEGLAEYCEIAAPVRGTPVLGAPHAEHVAHLAQGATLPDLEQLLHQTPEQFYAQSPAAYTSAWTFVSFLRHTTPARRRAFEELWARLDRREDNATALAGAFGAVDWRAWNAEFAVYARGLAEAPR